MLNVILLNVVKLNVVMLSVMSPFRGPKRDSKIKDKSFGEEGTTIFKFLPSKGLNGRMQGILAEVEGSVRLTTRPKIAYFVKKIFFCYLKQWF